MAMPAWAVELWERVRPYLEPLAVWQGYERELETLAIYGLGIAVYTALVFTFYNSLSRRRPMQFRASEGHGWAARGSRFIERAFLFPITSFLYFSVLALALFVMAKAQSVPQILLISMAVVVGVRVTVYMSEKMSNDLAKLVPLGLLAVILVDPGYLTIEMAWARLTEAITLWPLLGRYFLLFIALEAVMSSGRWLLLRLGAKWSDLGIRKHKDSTLQVPVKDVTVAPKQPPRAP